MKRLMEKTVFSGLVMACRLATWPTKRSPFLVNPTTDGVVRPPSSLGMTLGTPPSITDTTEFVVPKSIPIIFPIDVSLYSFSICGVGGKGQGRALQEWAKSRSCPIMMHNVRSQICQAFPYWAPDP